MAAVTASPSSLSQSADSDAFLLHILTLLEERHHKSPSFFLPTTGKNQSGATTTSALQQRVESAILSLSERCELAESSNLQSETPSATIPLDVALINAPSALLTPAESPPERSTPKPTVCPTCSRHLSDSSEVATRDPLNRSDNTMTAEKELELLKAQVSDIARVCKAVAAGDLTQKIIVRVEGHIMVELKGVWSMWGVRGWRNRLS